MRTTNHLLDSRSVRQHRLRAAGTVLLGVVVLAALSGLTGCANSANSGKAGSTEATGTPKGHGVAVVVAVTPEMENSKPQPAVLKDPESSVRSYIDWMSYAYRIGNSEVAKPAMSPYEEVRVDAYIQFNLQNHNRVIDQTLESITFGPISSTATEAIVPAQEKWNYSWVSAAEAGKVLGGPFSISYETTYTVVKNDKGNWLVDKVAAKELGKDK